MDQHETSPAVPEQRVSTLPPQLSDTGVDRVDIQAHARPPHRYHLARGGLEAPGGRWKTPMYVAVDEKTAGLVAVADTLKADSKAALAALRQLGLAWRLRRAISP